MKTKRLLTCAAVIAASTFGAINAQDPETDNAMSFLLLASAAATEPTSEAWLAPTRIARI